MERDFVLILIGAGVAIASGLITAVCQHILFSRFYRRRQQEFPLLFLDSTLTKEDAKKFTETVKKQPYRVGVENAFYSPSVIEGGNLFPPGFTRAPPLAFRN
jgi:hypothetical protein